MESPERRLEPISPRDPAAPGEGPGQADESLWSALLDAASAEEIPQRWLALQCRLAGSCRRALLLMGPPGKGPFNLAAAWPPGQPATPSLLATAERALLERSGFLVAAPDRGEAAALEGAQVAEVVRLGGELHGAVVLLVSPRPEPQLEAVREQLRLGLGWLDACVQRGRAQGERGGKAQLEFVLGVLALALEHPRFQGAATAFATELATELGCDRVSLGFEKRRKVRVRALSHSAQFGSRTNLVRAIEAAMGEAIDRRQTVVFPERGEEVAHADHAHAELARQFGAGSVCTVPLARDRKPCGAVTLERSEPFDPRTVELVEVAAALGGPVLEALRRDDRLLVAKVGESLRGGLDAVFGPHRVAVKLATGLTLALLVFLSVVTGTHRVTADALLEPALKRAAVAPFDAYVATAPVRAGDLVEEGQRLASLDDRDLQLERVKWQSESAQYMKQYRQAMAERNAAEVEIMAAALREASAELDRIEDRLSRTDLLAPFDGVVVEGDLTQRLGAPVERGEVLFEIAPLHQYRIHIQVDERDIDEVVEGQEGKLVLSSLPGDSFGFAVEKTTPVAEAEEGRNTFRVEARLDDEQARLRPGMQGVAKIDVGERRLIWIWTHEAVDWLRLQLWSWRP